MTKTREQWAREWRQRAEAWDKLALAYEDTDPALFWQCQDRAARWEEFAWFFEEREPPYFWFCQQHAAQLLAYADRALDRAREEYHAAA